MRTLYFDCGMGAAGDMLTASLYELLNNEERKLFIEKMNTVGIPKIKYEAEASTKCGIVGTHMKVTVDGMEEMEHHHHHDDDEHELHHHEHGEHCHCQHCQEGHSHMEEYGISTFVYYRRQPMDLGLFDEFVARHFPKNVIRAKGMIYFEEEYDTCYLFEQAGKQVKLSNAGQWFATMPKDELQRMMAHDPHLQHDWDERYGDRMQKLVFIGQKLDKKAIKAALDACLVD